MPKQIVIRAKGSSITHAVADGGPLCGDGRIKHVVTEHGNPNCKKCTGILKDMGGDGVRLRAEQASRPAPLPEPRTPAEEESTVSVAAEPEPAVLLEPEPEVITVVDSSFTVTFTYGAARIEIEGVKAPDEEAAEQRALLMMGSEVVRKTTRIRAAVE